MHPMSCQHLKCAFLSTSVRTPPVPNDHEVFPRSYSVHFCRLYRSLPTGKNLPSSVLWGLSLTCYCAACVQVLQEFAKLRLFLFSSILCADFAVRAAGLVNANPIQITFHRCSHRSSNFVEPSRSLAAGMRRAKSPLEDRSLHL